MPTNRTKCALCAVAICAALGSGPASARVRPDSDRSALSASVLRNIDANDPHWGASAGACWRGRIDLRFEARGGWIAGSDVRLLQAELALVKMRGLMLETGCWHAFESGRRFSRDIIPLRLSLPFDPVGSNRVILHVTAARFHDGPDDLIGFAGMDFMRGDRWAFSLEMNVNQDFRYHYLDLRLRRFW